MDPPKTARRYRDDPGVLRAEKKIHDDQQQRPREGGKAYAKRLLETDWVYPQEDLEDVDFSLRLFGESTTPITLILTHGYGDQGG